MYNPFKDAKFKIEDGKGESKELKEVVKFKGEITLDVLKKKLQQYYQGNSEIKSEESFALLIKINLVKDVNDLYNLAEDLVNNMKTINSFVHHLHAIAMIVTYGNLQDNKKNNVIKKVLEIWPKNYMGCQEIKTKFEEHQKNIDEIKNENIARAYKYLKEEDARMEEEFKASQKRVKEQYQKIMLWQKELEARKESGDKKSVDAVIENKNPHDIKTGKDEIEEDKTQQINISNK